MVLVKDYIFFGYSSANEVWGINLDNIQIISYHHNMGEKFLPIGNTILNVYKADYEMYSNLE